MKKFETPELEIVLFSVADVIATSGDEINEFENGIGWN